MTDRRPLRLIGLVAATASAALGVGLLGSTAAVAAEQNVSIDVLTFNDFHGRLEGSSTSAGAAVLGGIFAQARAANPNTIVASAGDNVGASTFTSFIQNDEPTIAALKAMKVDVSALGNHEFDQGRSDVDGRLVPELGFPLISANLYDKATDKPAFPPYYVKTTPEGVRVGFIGATTEDLPILVSPAGISTLDVKPIVSSVSAIADQLHDGDPANGEADVTILLQHEGPESGELSAAQGDTVFGKIVAGVGAKVDAIVAAHTHQLFDHDVPVPGTSKTIPVVEAAKYGEAYGRLAIEVDAGTHRLTSIDGSVTPINQTSATPDPTIAKIVADAVAVAKEKGQVSVGAITASITRGQKLNADGTRGENRGAESTLSNLIADAQLAATKERGAQVAIMNPGGVRDDLKYPSNGAATDPDGNVTYAEAASVQPFSNTLVTLDLTGAQLKTVLEQQWQPTGSSRPYLKLGLSKGLTYTYDPAAPVGSKIGEILLDGTPIGADQTIKVVTNSFLASGGDAFFELAKGTDTTDTGLVDLATFVDYVKTQGTISPDTAQRSIGLELSAPADPAGYAAGEQVTATLSSMLFTNGGPTSGDAAVELGDTTLGSAPLSYALSAAEADEQGSATVTFTIPDGLSGAQTLTVTGPGGTAIPVPITVVESAPAEPVATSVTGYADRLLSFGGRGVHYVAQVSAADGSAPVGTIVVRDLGRVVARAEVTADAQGRAVIDLPKLRRGVHIFSATFRGDGFERSQGGLSFTIVL